MDSNRPAPKFLNLLHIKLPPGGIASIAHRISGVLMFLLLPWLAWLFARSLESAAGFAEVQNLLASTPVLLVSLVLVWSLSHHLLAGIRHLLLDIDIGVDRRAARGSAWIVNIGALLMAAAYLVVRL